MKLPVFCSQLPRPYAPSIDEHSRPFWSALEEGKFLLGRCEHCGELQFPPRMHCVVCLESDPGWHASKGLGTLYASTRIHAAGGPFACMTPYTAGLVDLNEGVRVLLRLLPSASSLPPDSAVQLAIVMHTDGPLFAAIASENSSA